MVLDVADFVSVREKAASTFQPWPFKTSDRRRILALMMEAAIPKESNILATLLIKLTRLKPISS